MKTMMITSSFVIDVISDQELCQEDPIDFKKDEDLTNESEVEEEHVQVFIEGDNGDNTEEVQVPIEGEIMMTILKKYRSLLKEIMIISL